MEVQILQEADPKTGLNVQKYYKGTTYKRSQKVQDSQLMAMQSAKVSFVGVVEKELGSGT